MVYNVNMNESAPVSSIENPKVDSRGEEPKGKISLLRFSFVLSIVTTILCSLLPIFVALMFLIAFGSPMAGAYPIALVFAGLEFVRYAPFVILITLSAAASLVYYIIATSETSKFSSSARTKITKRSLVSAILLFAPAITYPIAYIISLYAPLIISYSLNYLMICFPIIFIVDLVVIIVLCVRKKKKATLKNTTKTRAFIITLFVAELILCSVWSFGIIYHKFDTDRSIRTENENREQTLQSLRNSSLNDGLSDLAATKCKLKPYKTIYSDNSTEGIFACDISDVPDEVLDIFYAAYYGKKESGKTEVSLIDLGRIYNNHHIMNTDIIGETGNPYSIIFIDAKDDTFAYKKIEEYFEKPSRIFTSYEREYIFYADGLSAPTTKDYLNVIFASNMYLPENNSKSCGVFVNWDFDEKYECIKASGDLFKRYINDADNYSSYSIDALFKNRHLYLAPKKVRFGSDSSRLTRNLDDFVAFWRKPFTQGKLTFKYLPSSVFDKHDGNLEWESEDAKY